MSGRWTAAARAGPPLLFIGLFLLYPLARIIVEGLEDMWVRLARCCAPVPGDDIVGALGPTVRRANVPAHILHDRRQHLLADLVQGLLAHLRH